MIVQPDFLDHWKVNALAARIGRLEAVTALIALWAHCQQRRTSHFDFTALMLAGICRYHGGDPAVLMETLLELRLIEPDAEGGYTVHEWAEVNSSLVHNWEAGQKGGRPKKGAAKNPRVNPVKTQGLTLGEPEAKPRREEEIRQDQRREEIPPVVPRWGTGAGEFSPEAAVGHWSPDSGPQVLTAEQRRVGALFGRPETAAWSHRELAAWNALGPVSPGELAELEGYYTANLAPTKDFRRQDLGTLLQHWPGELDRARRFNEQSRPVKRSTPF